MPELRQDPLNGRWVIIATDRARRPGSIVDLQRNSYPDIKKTLFDADTAQEIYRVGEGDNWKVRVVRCETPVLSLDTDIHRNNNGLYTVIDGYGAHEIVVETPGETSNMADLDQDQIKYVLETYRHRLEDLSKNSNLKYAFVYKGYSGVVSEGKYSSYSQIIASPVIPLHIKDKLQTAQDYYAKHKRSIYQDLIDQELNAHKRVIAQNDHFVVLTPFASRFPFEMNIFPKDHNCDFVNGIAGKERDLAELLKDVLMKVKYGLEDPAYNIVLNTSPFGDEDGKSYKTIDKNFCWHIEIVPRLTYIAGFEKGTGSYICPIPPEKTAEFMNSLELEFFV